MGTEEAVHEAPEDELDDGLDDALRATRTGRWRWDSTAGGYTLDAVAAELLGLPPRPATVPEAVVPAAVAGAALVGFSAGLLGLYVRTPGMRRGRFDPRSTPEGLTVSKDIWMLGTGLSLLIDGLSKDDEA